MMSMVFPMLPTTGESGAYNVGTVSRSRTIMNRLAVVSATTATDVLLCEILDELKAIRNVLEIGAPRDVKGKTG